MKKLIIGLSICIMLFSLASCSSAPAVEDNESSANIMVEQEAQDTQDVTDAQEKAEAEAIAKAEAEAEAIAKAEAEAVAKAEAEAIAVAKAEAEAIAAAAAVAASNTKVETIVYVTKTGEKYHSDGCQYLSKSKIAISLSDAKASYSPCSKCNPPR
jgi:membrane protein involved in colicin uptake